MRYPERAPEVFLPRIFISYRRDDTRGTSGRICDHLQREFGRENVFFDVATLIGGDDFVDSIQQRIADCDLLLAVIGPRWLSVVDGQGRPRLQDPADNLRIEIETALARRIRTIPLLVERGELPKADRLPLSLQPLTRLQCMELRDTRWPDDIDELIETIRGLKSAKPGAVAPPTPDEPPPSLGGMSETSRRGWPGGWLTVAAGTLVAAVAITFAVWRGNTPPAERPIEAARAVDSPAPNAKADSNTLGPTPATVTADAAKAPPAGAAVEAKPASRRAATPAPTKSTCGAPDECEKECAQGIGNACTNLGFIYRQSLDYARAAALYQKGCDAGDAQGCADIGDAYMTGMGVAQDANQAATLLQKACDGGSASGCLTLAIMVSPTGGFGLARDDIRAARLNQRGCDLGSMASCGNLAEAYQSGRGVLRNPERAVTLYTRACDGKDASSCDELGYLYEKGIDMPKDEARAASFYEKACAVTGVFARSTSGCRHLASAYEHGRGVARDLKRALELFRQACAGVTGSKDACADAKRLESEGQR